MTVKALLRSTPNRDGSHSIRIQVIENRKTSYVSTGERIHKSYWDLKKEQVKDSFPDSWKLFFWSLFRRPKLFLLAITYSIYGYHFRKVFGVNP